MQQASLINLASSIILSWVSWLLEGLVHYTGEYITEEPDAVVPHVRICVGTVQVTGRSTMTASKNILDREI
jgi:hypothetical protein